MQHLSRALQALQDESVPRLPAGAAGVSAGVHVSQGAVLRLAGQLLHAGRQDRAAQVCFVGGCWCASPTGCDAPV